MSRIICDVCGTAYPETATQCPICGCAKAPNAQVSGDDPQSQNEGYNHVKGGRFSKANVKKNNRSRVQEQRPVAAPTAAQQHSASSGYTAPERRSPRRDERKNAPEGEGMNKGLIAVVIVLLLAIILVVVYIGQKAFLGNSDSTGSTGSSGSTGSTQQSEFNSGESTSSPIPCTELKLSSVLVELKSETEKYLLEVRTAPQDTTDSVVFTSKDPSVATVDQNGLILSVSYGETVIVVTCGDISVECLVKCTVGEPEPTDPPTEPPVQVPDGFQLSLNRKDFTLGREGEQWTLYKESMGVKASDIEWTSSDPAVATVENGVVTGVDRGTATITAVIGDQKVECIVRCRFDAAPPTEPSEYVLSHTDVTLRSNQSFNLTLKDKNGANVQNLEWVVSDEGYVTINKNTVKAGTITQKKIITISTTYEGVTYTCTVRLVPAET